ncbi:MAG: hypothetical protein ACHQHN_17705 [Sphingobacteriales bacterium]
MTNKANTVLYVGVTSDLFDRVSKHNIRFTRVLRQNIIVINWFIMKSINGYMMPLQERSN